MIGLTHEFHIGSATCNFVCAPTSLLHLLEQFIDIPNMPALLSLRLHQRPRILCRCSPAVAMEENAEARKTHWDNTGPSFSVDWLVCLPAASDSLTAEHQEHEHMRVFVIKPKRRSIFLPRAFSPLPCSRTRRVAHSKSRLYRLMLLLFRMSQSSASVVSLVSQWRRPLWL